MSAASKKILKKKPVLECPHCGNKVPHQVKYVHEYTDHIYDFPREEDVIPVECYNLVLVCGSCFRISLYGGYVIFKQHFDFSDTTLLYPKPKNVSEAVPKQIREAYMEAVRISKSAPNAYACMIRRALEFMCEDKSAKGKNLKEKLGDLSRRKIIPPVLAEMTNIIRDLGNIGAHADATNIQFEDVEVLDDFFNAVIEYVYVAPDKIRKVKEALSKKK